MKKKNLADTRVTAYCTADTDEDLKQCSFYVPDNYRQSCKYLESDLSLECTSKRAFLDAVKTSTTK